MLSAPTAYYIGTVPEGFAMLAANQGPAAMRKNGAWEIMEEVYLKKAGAILLAWGESMTSYNTYLNMMPKMGADGVPDLTGVKMRATGTYRPLFRLLELRRLISSRAKSSSPLSSAELVAGFGFPDVAVVAIGLHKAIKYRVTPNYYQTNQVVTVNPASWKALGSADKKKLKDLALKYETSSVLWMEKARVAEEKQLKAAGVKDIALKGDAAKYLDIAHQEIWKQLKAKSEYHDKLKPLMYVPGKPNRQADLGRALRD